MKRAHICTPNEPLVITETVIPEAPSNGAVVQIFYSGICHSDIYQWKNYNDFGDMKRVYTDHPDYNLPLVPGHEIAGKLYSIGDGCFENDLGLKTGDSVVVYPWIGCGLCGYCEKDNTPHCQYGYNVIGFGASAGGYASHVSVQDIKFVLKLPGSIPLDVASLLPCSGLTAYNATNAARESVENAKAYKGKGSLMIIGAGGLGLWCLGMARQILPSKTNIVLADSQEHKLTIAKEYGCNETVLWDSVCPEKDIVERTCALGNNGGFDAILDFVNSQVTAERAQKCLNTGGTHVMVGLYGGAARISLPRTVLSSRKIQGIHVGRLQQLKDLLQLAALNKIRPPPLIYFKLDDVTKALTDLDSGKMNGRGIIKFE